MDLKLDSEFDEAVSEVFRCLDQGYSSQKWLETLELHTTGNLPGKIAAIGIDTNVLKILRRAPLVANNLLTYVEDKDIPLIVPGQSVHEYWNNHGMIVRDIDGIYNTVQDLQRKIAKVNVSEAQRDAVNDIEDRLNRLADDLHDSKRPQLLEESTTFWAEVLPKVRSCSVPRTSFKALAEVRFASKVAPGFADTKKGLQALGDFFVWADFLLGLLIAGLGSESRIEERVIFVTDDSKPDWKASNGPHPVLMGELSHLTGRHLQLYGSKDLQDLVAPN